MSLYVVTGPQWVNAFLIDGSEDNDHDNYGNTIASAAGDDDDDDHDDEGVDDDKCNANVDDVSWCWRGRRRRWWWW